MCAKAQAILTNAHCEILDSKSKSMDLGWTENAHFLEHSVYSTNSGTKQKKKCECADSKYGLVPSLCR